MAAALAPRTASPRAALAWPGVRVFEHKLFEYRRTFRGTLFFTFIQPVLFLTAMGLGLGSFIDRGANPQFGGVPYLAFLAPGLLAAQAMQTATVESTWPIMAAMRWTKTFDALLASPQGTRDIVLGHIYWCCARLAFVSAVFLVVMIAFGAATPVGALLTWPVAILTGLAFAAPISAFTATQKTESSFNVIFRFGITPLFLFSGAFFPISQLPAVIQPLAYATPLYHGVAVSRGIILGNVTAADAAIHIAVLVAFIVAGTAAAFVTFRRRLVK